MYRNHFAEQASDSACTTIAQQQCFKLFSCLLFAFKLRTNANANRRYTVTFAFGHGNVEYPKTKKKEVITGKIWDRTSVRVTYISLSHFIFMVTCSVLRQPWRLGGARGGDNDNELPDMFIIC